MNNRAIGNEGEDVAAEFLISQGYTIVERQWFFGHQEIDIIAKKGDILAIVEVKARASAAFGAPATFVNRQKQRHMIMAADAYISRKQVNLEVRFDIISVITGTRPPTVEHIEAAFYPTM